jgi:hypothetical protein
MKVFNRFDMEQEIMNCWNVCEDLETVCEGVLDREMTQDQIGNLLLGMKELYQLKFEKLWENFEAMCREQVQVKQTHCTDPDYNNLMMGVQTARGEYLDESD